jgi:hypothetical protein
MRDDNPPWDYGGDRLSDWQFFDQNHDKEYRVVTATKGDMRRAVGVTDKSLLKDVCCIRLSRCMRLDGEVLEYFPVFIVGMIPLEEAGKVRRASDAELATMWRQAMQDDMQFGVWPESVERPVSIEGGAS